MSFYCSVLASSFVFFLCFKKTPRISYSISSRRSVENSRNFIAIYLTKCLIKPDFYFSKTCFPNKSQASSVILLLVPMDAEYWSKMAENFVLISSSLLRILRRADNEWMLLAVSPASISSSLFASFISSSKSFSSNVDVRLECANSVKIVCKLFFCKNYFFLKKRK